MENNVDPKNTEKEAILSRSPLLAAFLDKSATNDPQIWGKMNADEFAKVAKEMEVKFSGRDIFNLGTYPLWLDMGISHIFSDEIKHEEQIGLIETIMAIGYQVESLDDLSKFRNDVIVQSVAIGAFKVPKSKAQERLLKDKVWVMLASGSYWRHVGEDNQEEVPEVFKKFIEEKLNFKQDGSS